MSGILLLEDFAPRINGSRLSGRPSAAADVLVVGFGIEPLKGPGPNDQGDDRRKPTLEADACERDSSS